MLIFHVQTVIILPSCGFNIQQSCVFSASNPALEAKKDKSTDIWFTPDIWFYFAKEYILSVD